jgi:hypothetical protein
MKTSTETFISTIYVDISVQTNQEIPVGSNLSPGTGYPEWDIEWFSLHHQDDDETVPRNQ